MWRFSKKFKDRQKSRPNKKNAGNCFHGLASAKNPFDPHHRCFTFGNFSKTISKQFLNKISKFFLEFEEKFLRKVKTPKFCKNNKTQKSSDFFSNIFSKTVLKRVLKKFRFVAKSLFGLIGKNAFHPGTSTFYFLKKTSLEMIFEKKSTPPRSYFSVL
jgi:hypothetical protein